MTSACIKFKSGFRHLLAEDFYVDTLLRGYNISSPYLCLRPDGQLILYAGYASDGATGARDRLCRARGWWTHDAIYQLIAEGALPRSAKAIADDLLVQLWREDGEWDLACRVGRVCVGIFGKARPSGQRPIIVAP